MACTAETRAGAQRDRARMQYRENMTAAVKLLIASMDLVRDFGLDEIRISQK